tara:strand:+ start:191 stop:397 length:207 start_codon:yes stop_codon:yes gene_type:complete
MPLYCLKCWEREKSLSAKVERRDVQDLKWGNLKGGLVCTHCLSLGVITRATCKTFYRLKTLRVFDPGR